MRKHFHKLGLLIVVALLLSVPASRVGDLIPESKPAYWPTMGWKSALPEDQGMDSAQLVRMFEYIETKNIALHSLLIVKNGYLVTEAYWHPYSPGDQHSIESITKSVIGTLIGIAIDHEEIISTDELLLDFFPDRTIKNLEYLNWDNPPIVIHGKLQE